MIKKVYARIVRNSEKVVYVTSVGKKNVVDLTFMTQRSVYICWFLLAYKQITT